MIKPRSLLWWLLLVCGLVCSGVLLTQRVTAERRDHQVCAAMSVDDLALLVESSGQSVAQWREALSKVGVRYFMGTGEQAPFILPMESGQAPREDLPLALVENHTRTSVELPKGFDLETYRGPLVKTLYLYGDYADRVNGDNPQEVENLLFRAACDRGLRLLILTPFYTTEGKLVSDLSIYTHCLNDLADRLASRGLSFGEGFSCMESAPLHPVLLMGTGLVPVLLGGWLLCRLLKKEKWTLAVSVLAFLAFAVLTLLEAQLGQKVLMLFAAIVFPCVAAYGLLLVTTKPPKFCQRWQAWPFLGASMAILGSVVLWGLVGGLTVAALMSSRLYLMEYAIFSGVKVALLLPVLFALVLLVWGLRRELLRVKMSNWLVLLLLAAISCGLFGAFVARSGDWKGSVSSVESAVRNGLEYFFYARPRSKELFFAVPCIPLFVWACRKEVSWLQVLCGTGICLECVSVVNTFCHAIAPVQVSLIRTLLAAGLGFVLGLVLTAVVDGICGWWCRTHPGMDQAT